VPLACDAILALMALIVLVKGNRDHQNVSCAVTIRQRVAAKRFIEESRLR